MKQEKHTQKFISYDKNGKPEYVVKVKQTKKGIKYSIWASDSDIWAEDTKNTCFMELKDDGNGIILDTEYSDLNYAEAHYLRVLLCCANYMDRGADSITLINYPESNKAYSF